MATAEHVGRKNRVAMLVSAEVADVLQAIKAQAAQASLRVELLFLNAISHDCRASQRCDGVVRVGSSPVRGAGVGGMRTYRAVEPVPLPLPVGGSLVEVDP